MSDYLKGSIVMFKLNFYCFFNALEKNVNWYNNDDKYQVKH